MDLRRRAWVGAAIYLSFGALWIYGSDDLLARLVTDREALLRYQTWKGWFYVALTAVLAWWLLRSRSDAEAALRRAEKQLADAFEYAEAGMTLVALDGRLLTVNARFAEIVGRGADELRRLRFQDITHPDDLDDDESSARQLIAGEIDRYRLEKRYLRPDGSVVWALLTVALQRHADGSPSHFVSVIQDISLLKQAQLSLQQALEHERISEASLRLALEGTGDGMWDWDLIADKVVYRAGFARLLRYEGKDLSADFLFRERLHPDDSERCIAAVRASIDHGMPFAETYRLRCFDGEYRWFHGRGMCHLDEGGQPQRFSGVLTDLSDRLRAEERLRLAAQALDSTQEGVLITDGQRRIVSVNRAFCHLLGYSEAEVLGRDPRFMSSGRHDRAFYDAMWAQIGRTGQWQGEIWNRRKNGELVPELLSISTVRGPRDEVTHYVGVFADISQLKDAEARLEHQALHDPLTHLPNRALFGSRLEQALHRADRDSRRLAVLLLDLDRFKDVNDSFGHLVGDELLCHVAQRLVQRLRQSDTLARLGGDEFALLMHDLQHDEDAARLAAELIDALGQPWRSSEGIEMNVGVSIGICIHPDHGRSSQALLQGADAALYRAKADGRGIYRYYADEMTRSARERLTLESRLRRALAEGQFVVHYQPQVDLRSGRIIGAEALVRWLDPAAGMVSPARFIPVAEETGLIGELGAWVLRAACREARGWLDAGLPPLTVAVNVSPRQFRRADLASLVQQVLDDTGLPAQRLELELTESALMERGEEALETLRALRGLGVGIAIDDFGTGYSSLAYLKRFPIDVLKIDRSFIAEIPRDTDDMEIASAIIAMGHSLGLRVLAEGVETAEQLAFLATQQCDQYQGYLRSAPVAAAALVELLRADVPGGQDDAARQDS